MARLELVVNGKNEKASVEEADIMRKEHVNLERGNAVARFDGEGFRRVY